MSDELDRLLRDALETEARSYEPGGDGLSRIRSRVTARRARRRWLMPSLAMAAVAAAVVGVIAVPSLVPHHDVSEPQPGQSTVAAPTVTPAPQPHPSTPTAALPNLTTIWPYQNRALAAAREPADVARGRLPYLRDAKQTALHFVSDYLGYSDPVEVMAVLPLEAGAGVVLGARNPNNVLSEVTTVYLVRTSRGDDEPYVVVRADAPQLRIGDVSPGQRGVVSVSGTVGGPHEAVQLRLLTADGAQAAVGNDGSVGALAPWRVLLGSMTKPVPPRRYAVVARTLSDANGRLSELTVRPYDVR